MKDITTKHNVYLQCEQLLDNRLARVKNYMADIQESLLSETKSSAGDKHETGRAMLQLEREKTGQQLAEIHKLKLALSSISYEERLGKVGVGSLVFTSSAHYFISVSLGALVAEHTTIYAISPETPIGQVLMGKRVGDQLSYNGNVFEIKKVL